METKKCLQILWFELLYFEEVFVRKSVCNYIFLTKDHIYFLVLLIFTNLFNYTIKNYGYTKPKIADGTGMGNKSNGEYFYIHILFTN